MTGIIQVVQTNLTTNYSTSSAGWQSVPGLSAIITPHATTNSVLLFVKINLASSGQNGVAFKVQRNGVDIDIGAAAGARTQATGCSFGTIADLDSGITLSEVFQDLPNSTSALTYQVLVNQGNSSGVFVNQGATDSSASNFYRTTSNILLLEFQP